MSDTIALDLSNTTNGQEWAQAFMAEFGDRKDDIDEGLMIAWFANAIEVGREAGRLATLLRLGPPDPKGTA